MALDKTLMVETRNRLDALRSGRADRPCCKGPRFDLARIPDPALGIAEREQIIGRFRGGAASSTELTTRRTPFSGSAKSSALLVDGVSRSANRRSTTGAAANWILPGSWGG